MRKWITAVAALLALAAVGCARNDATTAEGEDDVVIAITWQRLVTDTGETCERCGMTGEEFRKAVATLRESLRPLGIDVEAAEEALSAEEFAANTIESNRILIGGRTLEDWLGAETGESECESCCDAVGEDVKCRTVTLEGRTYEAIPAELIVRAGLVAASKLMESPEQAPCCPGGGDACEDAAPCCPAPDGEEAPASCCPGPDDGGEADTV